MLFLFDNDVICGDMTVPGELVFLISTIIDLIKIGVPVLLIIFGMLDLGKAVMAQKEDEIKKGQQTFVKRLMAAIIVFFVVFIVDLTIGVIANATTGNGDIWSCVSKLISHGK